MITEDYVSFETAKLLKEKGFDIDDCKVHHDPTDHTQYDITLQMVMKWLRESFGLFVSVEPAVENQVFTGYWHCYVCALKQIYSFSQFVCDQPTYELGCETVVKYCLENLV